MVGVATGWVHPMAIVYSNYYGEGIMQIIKIEIKTNNFVNKSLDHFRLCE